MLFRSLLAAHVAIAPGILHKLEMSREEAEKMLIMLTDVVHRKPGENTPDKLLKYAMKFKKNKFAASTRRIKWLR